MLRGLLRASAEDFQVDEQLGYAATGEGEHAFLRIRKRGINTADVARELARFAGVRRVNVGFAGLKDRHAVTTQYFSVHLPGMPDPDWRDMQSTQLQVLEALRHNRKIRRGSLRGNAFVLVLRQLHGPRDEAEQLLARIAEQGVPNYFGPQRFGRDASNLHRAARLLAGEGGGRPKPEQKRMLLSAARSYLFNRVLAARVRRGDWNQALPGEVVLLEGSNRQFLAENPDEEIRRRMREQDIHPSGPLPGRQGRTLRPLGEVHRLEEQVLEEAPGAAWIDALVSQGADSERRPLRLVPKDLAWDWLAEGVLQLTFALPTGAYGTTLVRELMAQASPGEPAQREMS